MLPVVEVSCESSRSHNQLAYGLVHNRQERESRLAGATWNDGLWMLAVVAESSSLMGDEHNT